jgi:polysaccharide biosynthesis transport protein
MSVNPLDLAYSLKARWKLILLVASVVFAGIVAIALLQPRKYVATSSLLVDLSQTDPTDDKSDQGRIDADVIIGTQVDVIKSTLVVDAVAQKLLGMQQGRNQTNVQEMAEALRAGLTVSTGRESNVLQLSYLDEDPARAAKVANLFADTFLAKQVDLRARPARGNAEWFDARTAEVRARLEAAQKRLSDFQREKNIIGVGRMDLEAEKLKNLSYQLVQAQAETANANSKAGASNAPEVAGSLVVQNLEQEVATASGEVSRLAKTLGPNHPGMKSAQARLEALQASLNAARSGQSGSLNSASASANQRLATLRSQMAAQEERMINMSGVQDQLVVLQRDVDAARQTYDTVRQRFNDAWLKGEIAQANTSLLDHATTPIFPSQPNLLLWFVGGLLLGGLAGLSVALILELIRPRVRSTQGLAILTELPVIADVSPGSARLRPAVSH